MESLALDSNSALGNASGAGEGNHSTDLVLARTTYTILGVYLCFIGLLAFIGNGLVISMIATSRDFRKKPQNLLLINLAVADLCTACCGFPMVAPSNFAARWLYGSVGCNIYGFVCFFFSLSALASLVAISFYRYIIICHPHKKSRLSGRFTIYVIAGTWLYAALFPVWPFFGWSHYQLEPFGTSCSVAWDSHELSALTYDVTTTIFCYILPLSAMAVCYILIAKKAIWECRGPYPLTGNHQRRRHERRVSMMCGMMVCMFFINWTPYAVLSLLGSFVQLSPNLTILPTMLAKAQPAVNPFLYALHHRQFREAARAFLCCWRMRKVASRQSAYRMPRFNLPNYDIFLATGPHNQENEIDKEGVYRGKRCTTHPNLPFDNSRDATRSVPIPTIDYLGEAQNTTLASSGGSMSLVRGSSVLLTPSWVGYTTHNSDYTTHNCGEASPGLSMTRSSRLSSYSNSEPSLGAATPLPSSLSTTSSSHVTKTSRTCLTSPASSDHADRGDVLNARRTSDARQCGVTNTCRTSNHEASDDVTPMRRTSDVLRGDVTNASRTTLTPRSPETPAPGEETAIGVGVYSRHASLESEEEPARPSTQISGWI